MAVMTRSEMNLVIIILSMIGGWDWYSSPSQPWLGSELWRWLIAVSDPQQPKCAFDDHNEFFGCNLCINIDIWATCCQADPEKKSRARAGKFINFFPVIRFENSACVGAGGLKGTCYTEKVDLWIERPLELIGTENYFVQECSERNGAPTSSCAGEKNISFLFYLMYSVEVKIFHK